MKLLGHTLVDGCASFGLSKSERGGLIAALKKHSRVLEKVALSYGALSNELVETEAIRLLSRVKLGVGMSFGSVEAFLNASEAGSWLAVDYALFALRGYVEGSSLITTPVDTSEPSGGWVGLAARGKNVADATVMEAVGISKDIFTHALRGLEEPYKTRDLCWFCPESLYRSWRSLLSCRGTFLGDACKSEEYIALAPTARVMLPADELYLSGACVQGDSVAPMLLTEPSNLLLGLDCAEIRFTESDFELSLTMRTAIRNLDACFLVQNIRVGDVLENMSVFKDV